MVDRLSSSPFQTILKTAALGLSPEQRRELELRDVEFRSEVIRLVTERDLLELDAVKTRMASSSGMGFTGESLAAVDAITAKIRQAWLRAMEAVRPILSPTQTSVLDSVNLALPRFDADMSPSPTEPLETLVAQAVASRLKDAKVIEIETTQAIAERLLAWVKTAALVTAVPLTLLAVVLAVLGINNWTDFNSRIEKGKSEVSGQLTGARSDARELREQANALKEQYADLKRQFGDVSSIATNVRILSTKVDHLEQIRFGRFKGFPTELD